MRETDGSVLQFHSRFIISLLFGWNKPLRTQMAKISFCGYKLSFAWTFLFWPHFPRFSGNISRLARELRFHRHKLQKKSPKCESFYQQRSHFNSLQHIQIHEQRCKKWIKFDHPTTSNYPSTIEEWQSNRCSSLRIGFQLLLQHRQKLPSQLGMPPITQFKMNFLFTLDRLRNIIQKYSKISILTQTYTRFLYKKHFLSSTRLKIVKMLATFKKNSKAQFPILDLKQLYSTLKITVISNRNWLKQTTSTFLFRRI